MNAPVLYVEDEENDAMLLEMAFRQAEVKQPFRVLKDGAEAIAYLAGNGLYADRRENPLPCLVILDLNLPRKSGLEVLEWIRHQAEFARLPVVVYTSSAQDLDKQRARCLGASDFQVKLSKIPEMVTWVKQLRERWLRTAPNLSPGS